MFNRMRKCLDNFEKFSCGYYTAEAKEYLSCFYLDLAKAMLLECPDADKVAKVILVEYGLFDDIKFRLEK